MTEKRTYTRIQVLAMLRPEILGFFSREGLPKGLTLHKLESTTTDVLRSIMMMSLEAEGRIKG